MAPAEARSYRPSGRQLPRANFHSWLRLRLKRLDGGTGGFILLEPLENADRIILIDAAADGNPPGIVTRTTPRFWRDDPPALTAHDIRIKDLLDAFHTQGGTREVILYAIAIDPNQPILMKLSETVAKAAAEAEQRILAKL